LILAVRIGSGVRTDSSAEMSKSWNVCGFFEKSQE